MKIIKKISEINLLIQKFKQDKKVIALVPTMGSLHEGHLSLVEKAREKADIVIVSIFVNEKQFNDKEDFNQYPRNLEDDCKKLILHNVDIVFCPNNDEIYQNNNINLNITSVLENVLCGKSRPGHFNGVALIIIKLFNIIEPDYAIFGEKDFQQLQIIKELTSYLNFKTRIIAGEIYRSESGLALSSRNLRLDVDSLKKSANLYKILKEIKKDILENKKINQTLLKFNKKLEQIFDKVDYLEICQEKNLQIINNFDKNLNIRIFVAVYINQVRIIDNLKIS